jgi:two-component system NarL family sensor kinase
VVVRLPRRIVDYFAAEPVRVSAVLRLPLIALMGFLVWLWEVDSWLPGVYAAIPRRLHSRSRSVTGPS